MNDVIGCSSRVAHCSSGRVVECSIAIIDLSGLSFRTVTHSTLKKLMKYLAAINSDHYPESLKKMFIVNTPRVFSLGWSMMKPLLDERTLSKITIYSDGFTDALLEYIDIEVLPTWLGGRCDLGEDLDIDAYHERCFQETG